MVQERGKFTNLEMPRYYFESWQSHDSYFLVYKILLKRKSQLIENF